MTTSVAASVARVLVIAPLCLAGCHVTQRRDFVVTSAANLSHTYRATVLVREYLREDKPSRTPTTYVLLDRFVENASYEDGADFHRSQIVMKPAQCGPLALEWVQEKTLKITCNRCGLSLVAVGPHRSEMGDVEIRYEGFPEASSWEGSHASR